MGVALYEGKVIDYYTNPIGDVWYVRGDGADTGNSGRTPAQAFLTLEHAVHDIAGDWDTIIMLPPTDGAAYLIEASQGVDDANVPIIIDQRGLKIIGLSMDAHTIGLPTVHTHVANVNVFEVNANEVEIAGLNIQVQGNGTGAGIYTGSTAATRSRLWVHDCSFFGVNLGRCGVDLGRSTAAHDQCVVERCYFEKWVTSGLRLQSGAGTVIRNNVFQIGTAGYGIDSVVQASGLQFTYINDNKFVTTDNTDAIGINMEQQPDLGMLGIDGNSFQGFADTAHCIEGTRSAGYLGLNYHNGAAITS